ncbi:MAG: outer-membrane lipoprotein carrier protein LolA [Hyphomonadaceae bacterium]|nr:outer-membrane lipoprotein carrier protein LolA [Hyphomonadaceae bacterium]
MNRRIALAALALAALSPAAFAQDGLRARTQTEASGNIQLSGAEREAALARANATLNGVQRLQARFTQTAPDGSVASGTLYMQRPGKLRFAYDPPATILIVSDGNVVHLRDTALRNTERTNLESTPLNLILRSQVDLARDSRILGVARNADWIMVRARDKTGLTDGEITMYFKGANTDLRAWDIVDATGARTRIVLTNVTQPASFNQSLFRMEDMLESRRPGRP